VQVGETVLSAPADFIMWAVARPCRRCQGLARCDIHNATDDLDVLPEHLIE